MLRKYFIFSLLITLFPSAIAFAWSATGHGIVGDIAFRYLSPAAKAKVIYYMKGRSVHQACTWMDSVKGTREYAYLTVRHYVNVDKGATYDTTSTNNIVFELNRVMRQLGQMNSLSDSIITQYVLELFHLVGDIHQPLHCGYGIDVGGNNTRVTFLGQYTNLHSAWDYSLVQSGNVNIASCLAANKFTPSELQEIKQSTVFDWMNESMQLVDYCYYPENSNALDSNYLQTRLPIVQQQLLKAGLRLAAVLEMYFGDKSSLPLNLSSFEIQSSSNGNVLFWESAMSKHIILFLVERSEDGINFKPVGTVDNGQMDGLSSYHFVDLQEQGKVYYRLKMLFDNGSTQYSTVLKADWLNVAKNRITVSPNPATVFLTARFVAPKQRNIVIKLLGIDGKVYKVKECTLNAGNVSVTIDLDGVKKGVYLLHIEGVGVQKVLVE